MTVARRSVASSVPAGRATVRVGGGAEGRFLPVTLDEARRERGWDELDVVIVTGDAYVDHPSFGPVLVARWLEAHGFRVGLLPQPDWRSAEPFRALGRPRLFFGVSAGNLDSMVNHYTSRRRRRSEDAYSPGGRAGARPDRAAVVYAQRVREAFPGVPVVLGGIEASLRRLAHYDVWSDSVRRSILLDAKADLLVCGMGEATALAVAERLRAGEPPASWRDLPGTAVRLGPAETAAEEARASRRIGDGRPRLLPAYEEARDSPEAFARMTRIAHQESNPGNARPLVQRHGPEGIRVNPPAPPLSGELLDAVYELRFLHRAHPVHREPVPALETVRHSVVVVRGCAGGCAFCALTLHQGRAIRSRSAASVCGEVERLGRRGDFRGTVSDLGGPTANLYRAGCDHPRREAACRRTSCLHPAPCPHFRTDPGPLFGLLRAVREVPGVRHALVASGLRTDVAERQPGLAEVLARHHAGGQLSVAPEHAVPAVLARMRKPSWASFRRFADAFAAAGTAAGREQYVVPYLIAGHPGCTLADMVELALRLRREGFRPRQVQEFLPTPGTLATAMYRTGLDPLDGTPVHVPRGDRERRLQKALLFYWDPERHAEVREALRAAGREDLIGRHPGALVPPGPAGGRSGPGGPDRGGAADSGRAGRRTRRGSGG